MNIKNNNRYKASSEKIETAFLSLLYENKYEDITIKDICDKSGINRSTFYAHYDDINDLIIKIEGKFAHGMAVIFDYGFRRNNDAFVEMFTFVKENKYFYKAFLNIPYITLAEKNAKNEILTNIKDKDNNLGKDIGLHYRASFFGAGIKEICRLWLARDCEETPEQMAKILLREYSNRNENN